MKTGVQGAYFRLYNACFPVKGAAMGLICDVQRKELLHIPSLLAEVLEKIYQYSVEEIKDVYDHQYDKGIDAYLAKLVELGVGFYTHNPEAFPAVELSWGSPLEVYAAVIEVESVSNYDVGDVIRQLDDLGCAGLQVRFLEPFSVEDICSMLQPAKDSRLKFIELYIRENGELEEQLFRIVKENRRVTTLVVHSAGEPRIVFPEKNAGSVNIVYTGQPVRRGQPDMARLENFVASTPILAEARHFNIALNRKVCIDAEGFIRNYVSHEAHFGHVSQASIRAAVESPAFREKWRLHNDLIEQCRDCQYRYLCLSNSDVVENGGKYHKKEICDFDPYTNTWHKQTLRDQLRGDAQNPALAGDKRE